jgi:hypothetical protein
MFPVTIVFIIVRNMLRNAIDIVFACFKFLFACIINVVYVLYESITPSKLILFVLQKLLSLEESLKNVDTSNTLAVCRIIDQFSEQPSLKENSSLNR